MKKILIIEDDELLGDLLLQKLKSSGYECVLMREGSKGYAKISEWMPDMIVLDLFLPILNGFDILAQKRMDAKIATIPVIVLTNSLRPTSATAIEKLGASDFLVKSDVTQEEIVERIRKIFEKTSETDMGGAASKGHDVLVGKKILVVEDDKFLGSILVSRLMSRKVKVVYATSGEAALEELKKDTPEAVLLDIMLPGIDGFEVLKQIRENPATKALPVMILSNISQVKDKEKAESMGAGFLVKALVNPDDIVAQTEEILRSK
ncbi:MAG: response regulator [bacterium]